MSFKSISSLALILMGLFLLSCDRIVSMHEANRLRAMADSIQQDTTTTDVASTQEDNGRQAALLSAFFGLDDALPRASNRGFCHGAAGKDGMPVVFSHEIDIETMQAGDFRIVTESGAVGEITCVTPAPADDLGEARTILIIGQYGSAEDQPASVEIVGNLLSKDRQLNFLGTRTPVVALEEGPTMVWAEVIPEPEWELGKSATSFPGGGGDGCPLGTKQVVRVTWAGGVTKPGGQEINDIERAAYRVTMSFGDKVETELVPFAIGDRGDGDNNHELCLGRAGSPLHVDFPAGFVTDPREDLNPHTQVEVTLY
jgi:hypothetical protein